DGVAVGLTLYRDPEGGDLFLPFQDETSGNETYGAGRYLDVTALEDGRVLLDFNYAYHPFCAYNPSYSCPMPPVENRLPAPIRAGERNLISYPSAPLRCARGQRHLRRRREILRPLPRGLSTRALRGRPSGLRADGEPAGRSPRP